MVGNFPKENVRNIKLSLGEKFRLDLRENGSTGYVWNVDEIDPNLIVQRNFEPIFDLPIENKPIGGDYPIYFSISSNTAGIYQAIIYKARPWDVSNTLTERYVLLIEVEE
jgi:predicted secreted protein